MTVTLDKTSRFHPWKTYLINWPSLKLNPTLWRTMSREWKDVTYHMSLGNCKLKSNKMLEWSQSQALKHQNLGRIKSNRDSHSLLVECKILGWFKVCSGFSVTSYEKPGWTYWQPNSTATLKDGLTVFYKAKHSYHLR